MAVALSDDAAEDRSDSSAAAKVWKGEGRRGWRRRWWRGGGVIEEEKKGGGGGRGGGGGGMREGRG